MTTLRRLDQKGIWNARAEGWPTGTTYEKICENQMHLTVGQFLIEIAHDEQVSKSVRKKYIQWAVDCGVKIPTRKDVQEGRYE